MACNRSYQTDVRTPTPKERCLLVHLRCPKIQISCSPGEIKEYPVTRIRATKIALTPMNTPVVQTGDVTVALYKFETDVPVVY
ncbi:hypothetical protein P879_03625 [Paragonimus westermani]|uniref:Uncharacterized protein n=1 Tax=Paragonimus westermani TaxID=34504 RepID=A0A8T0DFE8_9TREM|nr:hypothetical protein P879_03625 [Paragonimus westermani]